MLFLRGPEITPDWAVESTLELSTHCKATFSMLFDLLFLWVLNSYCGALPMFTLHAHPGLDGFSLFLTKATSPGFRNRDKSRQMYVFHEGNSQVGKLDFL